jgi:hypothetical protein
MRYHPLLAVLAGALALGCIDDQASRAVGPDAATVDQAGTASAQGARSSVSRPLFGRCTMVVTRISPPPPIEVQRIEYTCRISHLGLTRAIVTQTVDVTTGALSTTGVYVAANGDQLNSEFSGTAQITFTGPTAATVSFEGVQQFDAGSGRFQQASGSARLVGSYQLNPVTGAATGEFTLRGTLTY